MLNSYLTVAIAATPIATRITVAKKRCRQRSYRQKRCHQSRLHSFELVVLWKYGFLQCRSYVYAVHTVSPKFWARLSYWYNYVTV